MRIPLPTPLKSRNGLANKDARMTNALAEKRGDRILAAGRPGLTIAQNPGGVGNGLVDFNGTLIGVYGGTVYQLAKPIDPGAMPSVQNWYGSAWNGTVFTAVSGYGGSSGSSDVAATSIDGLTWDEQTLPSVSRWIAITWNGTVFCAVSGNTVSGIGATSPDGVTWTTRTLPTVTPGYWAIGANGSGLLCALSPSGSGSAHYAVSSNDGGSWSGGVIALSNFGITSVAWNGSVFCFVGVRLSPGQTINLAYTSPNGTAWTGHQISGLGVTDQNLTWVGIAWNGTVFCTVTTSSDSPVSATSPDGATWTLGTIPDGFIGCSQIVAFGDRFYVTEEGTSRAAYSVDDGVTWNIFDLGFDGQWATLCAGDDRISAIAYNSDSALAIYSDAIDTRTVTDSFFDFVQSTT